MHNPTMKINQKLTLGAIIIGALISMLFLISCGESESTDMQAGTAQNVTTGSSQSGNQNLPAMSRERFVLRDLEGNVRKWSEFAGKPMVINFWATWCGPCLREMPILKKLYAEYKPQGLEIIGISVDQQNTIARVVPFVKQVDIPWIIVYGDQSSAREFGLGRSIPMTVFLDANGNETGRLTGAQPEHIFRREFEKIM